MLNAMANWNALDANEGRTAAVTAAADSSR
jgi:hypothetical protein